MAQLTTARARSIPSLRVEQHVVLKTSILPALFSRVPIGRFDRKEPTTPVSQSDNVRLGDIICTRPRTDACALSGTDAAPKPGKELSVKAAQEWLPTSTAAKSAETFP